MIKPPVFLTRPCPWCGQRTGIPPALPWSELSRQLEEPCRCCRGGIVARSSLGAFAAFALFFGLSSNLTIYAAYHTLSAQRALPAQVQGQLAWQVGAWALLFAALILISTWFLVSNSVVARGRVPGRVRAP